MNKSNIFKLSACALFLMACGTNASAQATATATASATIITPIAISNNADMNFGNLAVGASGGTVTLAPALGARTTTGTVTLVAPTSAAVSASFTVTGASGFTYAITLPGTVVISSGGNHMNVQNFTASSNIIAGVGTLTGGTQTFGVGADLVVSTAQAPGAYTTTAPGFDVTVNYN